jgi:RNA polymerase sigma factor (sigma-70 family)
MGTRAQEDQGLAEHMRLAQGGDGAAYVELLERITPLLQHAVRRKRAFLQPHDVDDLVQSVLLALHSVRMTYDPRRPFLPWLMAIARNQIVDNARRCARQAANETRAEFDLETFSHGETNIHEENYGDPDALRVAIDALPANQRRAIEMLRLKEMTLKEAAAASGLSIPALKVAVYRAIKTLRKVLAREE